MDGRTSDARRQPPTQASPKGLEFLSKPAILMPRRRRERELFLEGRYR
ncbi:MAG TPA: hypothetical protein VFO03_10465 [Gaiellaceae bacterium]|nr:hypothetical protein [Gaiellaceae bacterium]